MSDRYIILILRELIRFMKDFEACVSIQRTEEEEYSRIILFTINYIVLARN